MLVPLSWLSNYVPVTVSPKELSHRLTMAGTEISSLREIGESWDRDKILVGHVVKIEQHPNADRLMLPTVDLGNGREATVVCGGPNLLIGQKVAFAMEGAVLFNSRSRRMEALKTANIRGVVSAGMVCSELELGLGRSHEGILVLDAAAPVGMSLVDYLGDAVMDAEVTPNRPDCLSILGVAHEVAAVTGVVVTEPCLFYEEKGQDIERRAKVEIVDPDLCYRYCASLVSGVTVAESPKWLQDALMSVGMRSINNIVDVTNYVMLEYGQPLHAFNFDSIKDGEIVVRKARPGEKLLSLDDEILQLDSSMLTIADSRDVIALAGVIGGTETGVQVGTTSILLESANFDHVNTRRICTALNIRTEASYRFERGIRAELAPRALKRATQLILEVAGGEAAKGIIDKYPGRKDDPVVNLSMSRIRQVLGVDLSVSLVEEVLVSLGFQKSELFEDSVDGPVSTIDRETVLRVEVPYWRSDISIEDDLVEEVARIVGYDEIPTTMLSGPLPHHEPRPYMAFRESVRDILVSAGMQEVISYSLTSCNALDRVGALADGPKPIGIANPLSAEMDVLRTSLRGSLLEAIASNTNVSKVEGIRLFEIGRVYLLADETRCKDLPDEKEMLVGMVAGQRFPTSWMTREYDMGFFDAKGIIQPLFGHVGAKVRYEASTDTAMHPGKTASIISGDQVVGLVGELHPSVLTRFGLDQSTVAMFEIDLELLNDSLPDEHGKYMKVNRFPESLRDLALIVDVLVPSTRIQSIIDGHKLVKHCVPFDIYTGSEIPVGKKSIAYTIVFQSQSATLTTEQVDCAQSDILLQIRQQLGAELRE